MELFPGEELLIDLLGQQAGLLEQMAGLLKEQSRMIALDEADGADPLLDVMGEEARDELDRLRGEAEPLFQAYGRYSESAGGRSEAVDEALDRIIELLEEGASLSERNLAEAKEKAEGLTRQIDDQRTKRQGIGAYAQGTGSNSAIFDRKS